MIVTVPNREKRSRADVTCQSCGCRYNPDRHLRSFAPEQLTDLLPGFRVDRIIETGPRQPVYPRFARLMLERAGLLRRPGTPSCPQCGARYRYATASSLEPGPTASANGSAGPLGSTPAALCSQAPDGAKATGGKFTADAQLTLTTPEFAAAGSYTGTLTLSLA